MPNNSLNIFERLSAISNELSAVAKNLEVGVGQAKYKAVGEADVLAAVKPLENKYRVYSYPFARKVIESGYLESTDRNGVVRRQVFERIETTYRFVNMDKTDEFIDIVSYGDGVDSQDKSVGKAMTYADKYALMKAYKIITGDDPDQNPSEEHNEVKITTKQQPISEELVKQCEELGIKLEDIAKFYKCDIERLTDAHVTKCIIAKKKKLEKAQQVAPAPVAQQTTTQPAPKTPVEPQEKPLENTNDDDWEG